MNIVFCMGFAVRLTLQTCAGKVKELAPSVPLLFGSCPQGGHVPGHAVSRSSHTDPEDRNGNGKG